MAAFEAPEGFEAPAALALSSRFSNIDGGYKLVNVDDAGYGVYQDEEDAKFLFYLPDYRKWFVADELGSTSAYVVSEDTQVTNPALAKFKGLAVKPVDLEACEAGVWDENHHDEKFVDPDFEPNPDVCGVELQDAVWVRAVALQGPGHQPVLFHDIEPLDVCQGALGDCWLMAAISALAEFPNFIEEQVFVTKEFNPEGSYDLRFYDLDEGAFTTLTVDSLIPCRPKAWWEVKARPIYAQPKDDELYILLLEKAFAKYAGGYSKLNGGFPCLAWLVLTGCEDQQYWSRKEVEGEGGGFQWAKGVIPMQSRREQGLARDFQSLSIAACPDATQPMDDDAFFEVLRSSDSANYLMGASISGSVMEKQREDGLVERHAYSLLSAVQAAEDVRLVELRNPWGNDKEWNGDWSDNSELWSERPDVKAAVSFESGGSDGRFWMSYESFVNAYTDIQICAMTMPTPRGSHDLFKHDGHDDPETASEAGDLAEAPEESQKEAVTPRQLMREIALARRQGDFRKVRRLKRELRDMKWA